MKLRAFYIIVFFYTIQTMSSCCDCENSVIEIIYQDIDVNVIDTSGYSPKILEGSEIYRNSVALQINMISEINEHLSFATLFSDFSFSSMHAVTCDCYVTEKNENKVKDIKIYILEPGKNEETEITNYFRINQYELHEIQTYLKEFQNRNQYYFELELTEFKSLPATLKFKVVVILEDDTLLQQNTQLINFIN